MEEHSKWRIPGGPKQVMTSFVPMAASVLSDLEYKEICVLARMHMQEKYFENSANEMELSLEMFGDKELELLVKYEVRSGFPIGNLEQQQQYVHALRSLKLVQDCFF